MFANAAVQRRNSLQKNKTVARSSKTINFFMGNDAKSKSDNEASTDIHGSSGLENGLYTKYYFQRFLQVDFSCMVLSSIGLILSVFQYDLEFLNPEDVINLALVWIIFVTTIILAFLTIYRYLQLLQLQKFQKLIGDNETLMSAGLLHKLIVEILIIFLIPYPFLNGIEFHGWNFVDNYDVTYHYNNIFQILIILRIIYILRVFLGMTQYSSYRSARICKLYSCRSDYLYALKCIFRNSPIKLLFVTMVGSIFVFGHALRIGERPIARVYSEYMNMSYYWNNFWLVILTMTTVGYGDYYPKTAIGRIVVFFVCIWGVFIVSMTVVSITNTLSFSRIEQKSFVFLNRIKKKREVREEAAFLLTIACKIKLVNNHIKLDESERKERKMELIEHFQRHLQMFRMLNREYKDMKNDDMNLTDRMNMQFDHLKNEIKDIMANQKGLEEANKKISEKLGMNIENLMKEYESKTKNAFKKKTAEQSKLDSGGEVTSNQATERNRAKNLSIDYPAKQVYNPDLINVLEEMS